MAYVALVYGGFSGEAEVSKKSANEIFNAFNTSIGTPILVRIIDKNWTAEFQGKDYVIDKNDFSFVSDNLSFSKKINSVLINKFRSASSSFKPLENE